jgi:hypothetical protein
MTTFETKEKILAKLETLPRLYSTDSIKGDLPAVCLAIGFTRATWVLWEYEFATRDAFGLCDLGLGFPELGYVNINEILETAENMNSMVLLVDEVETRFAGYKDLSLEVPKFLVA